MSMRKFVEKIRNLSENDKIVYKNVLGAFIVKGGSLLISLFTLPAYISFFNNDEVLGLWYTILSLLNWILNFDLGIGNGLRNHLSTALSINDKDSIKRYISSAYFSIGMIVFLLILICPPALYGINLNALLNIDIVQISERSLYLSIVIVLVGVLVQFWLKLINSILYALQKSSVNNFLVLCSNILILIVVSIFPSHSNDVNVIVMSTVHAVAVALPLLVATIIVFSGKLKFAIPNIKCVTKKHIRGVLSLGGVFFIIQIAYMFIMSTNEFLITKISGNAYVVDYQAYYKLFSLGSTVFALAITPIWSAVTKAKAENNNYWIRRTYKRFMILALIFCAGELPIIPLAKPIMFIWLGEENVKNINISTSVLFSILACLMMICSVLSSIANGVGKLKVQAVCYIIGAIIKIPLSVILTKIIGSWNGVVIANIICIGLYCIIQPFYMRKVYSDIS